jgi:hypothetical protein
MDGMNEEEIMNRIKQHLVEQTGERTGGSGHLSNASISDIKIEDIKRKDAGIEVTYSYTVDIESEFTVAEEPSENKEPDPLDPYHYRKTEKIILTD